MAYRRMLLVVLLAFLSSLDYVLSEKGILVAENATSGIRTRYCMDYAENSNVTTSDNEISFYPLVIPSEWNACAPSNGTLDILSKVVMVYNDGSCKIATKVYVVQTEGGVGLVVQDKRESEDLDGENSWLNFTGPTFPSNETITIPVVFVSHEVAEILREMEPDLRVAMFTPPVFQFDYSLIAIWFIAEICVCIGAYWCGVSYYNMITSREVRHLKKSRVGAEQTESRVASDNAHLKLSYINGLMIVALVVIMCIFLVCLYFFYDYLVYLIIGLFFVASTTAIFQVIDSLTHKLFPCQPWRFPEFKICGVHFKMEWTQVLLAMGCLAVSCYWVYIRNEYHSWILQDILGTFFCINVLRVVRLPNMMILTLLMALLFLYDIFFVFVTPLMTKSGESIMVKVATGSTSGEKLPMLFKFPHFENPLEECRISGFSILGFGDILIPGLTVSFVHGFDLEVGSKRIYFISSVIAYGVGLLITFGGIYIMRSAQPALLYLVPCVLITIYIVAAFRREVKAIWSGVIPDEDEAPRRDETSTSHDNARAPSESTSSTGISESTEERSLIS